MLIIEVVSDRATERGGTTQDGGDWHIIEQEGYLHIEGRPFPVEMKLQIRDDQAPYKPGKCEVQPNSVRVSRIGQLVTHHYIDVEPIQEAARMAS